MFREGLRRSARYSLPRERSHVNLGTETVLRESPGLLNDGMDSYFLSVLSSGISVLGVFYYAISLTHSKNPNKN